MKKLVLTLNLVLFLTGTCFAEISLTQDQFDNSNIIHQEIKSKQAEFLGISGSKESIRVYGISEEEFLKELGKIDLEKLKKDKKDKSKDDKRIGLLDAIGLVESDLEKIKNLP